MICLISFKSFDKYWFRIEIKTDTITNQSNKNVL